MASGKKPAKELRLHYDATLVESADNGDTTYYGGVWSLNGEERQARGDDRSDNYKRFVVEAVLGEMEKLWPKDTIAEYDFLHDSLEELVEDGPADAPYDLFTFVAKKVKGKLEVWGEATPKDVLAKKAGPAQRIGDLLGDLLAQHLDEHEDELARALAESIGEDPVCKKVQVVRQGKELHPTEETKKVVLDEAVKYLREALPSVLFKALNPG